MSRPVSDPAVRPPDRGPQSTTCAAISALVRERWGRGPRRSRAYWAGRDAMIVILDDAHTDAERTLIDHGHGEEVLAGRRLLAEITEPDVRRIAGEATGRSVRAALSQSALDPPASVIVLLFAAEPREDAGDGERDDRLHSALREALAQTSSARALVAESEQAQRRTLERRSKAEADRRRRTPG
jgi:uncharacterized protein YbcI